MSLGAEVRLSALDSVLDEEVRKSTGLVGRLLGHTGPDATLASELFGVVDLLDSTPALRRALTDPGRPESARKEMVHSLLDGKISTAAVNVVAEAVAMRWPGPNRLVAAIERQAVRAELLRADSRDQLENTEDELFRFARLVKSTPALRDALADRSVQLDKRQQVIEELLAGKATDTTITLAKRAVVARDRTVDHTLEGYVTIAADLKNRVIATVRVARPLTEDQVERLQSALSRQAARSVFVQVIVDEQVLGGGRVELGDEVIEGTVAGRLENARRLFS
jgi:F-type H+-transporting ATPase subunit delta